MRLRLHTSLQLFHKTKSLCVKKSLWVATAYMCRMDVKERKLKVTHLTQIIILEQAHVPTNVYDVWPFPHLKLFWNSLSSHWACTAGHLAVWHDPMYYNNPAVWFQTDHPFSCAPLTVPHVRSNIGFALQPALHQLRQFCKIRALFRENPPRDRWLSEFRPDCQNPGTTITMLSLVCFGRETSESLCWSIYCPVHPNRWWVGVLVTLCVESKTFNVIKWLNMSHRSIYGRPTVRQRVVDTCVESTFTAFMSQPHNASVITCHALNPR